MCDFCEGKKILPLQNINNVQATATIKQQKYLYVSDGLKEYIYDLCFCPECGKQLNYYDTLKVYITNITKDTSPAPKLHQLVCDVRFDGYKKVNKQIVYTLTEEQLNDVKKDGYCFVSCFKSIENCK